jgi:regulator of sigma E protease
MILTLIIFIIVLSVLIFVHEAGHFWAARIMGVKVEEFGFGLPPRAVGALKFRGERLELAAAEKNIQASENLPSDKEISEEVAKAVKKIKRWKFFWGNHLPEAEEGMKADDTIFSINWLPLGGFCNIKGADTMADATEQDSFVSKAIWKRIIIISAGVIMNVVLAAVLFSAGYIIGLPESIDSADKDAIVSEQKIQIIQVLPDTPAAKTGLKAGDAIETIDGQKFTTDAGLQNYVNSRAGKELNYQIKRDDKITDFKIVPEAKDGKGQIGIAIINTGLVRYPWYLAIWKGAETAVILTWFIITAFYELLKNLIMGHGVAAQVAGPVGIAAMTGQYARMGFVYLLQFVGLLSLNLAVVNFLPFPALDGGRIIFLLIEKIKGSPVKREVEAAIHNVGFLALILLILVITVKDISHYIAPLVNLWQRIF